MDANCDAFAALDDSEEFPRFVAWVHRNFLNPVRLWRKLDVDGNMLLHKAEFMRGMRGQGYGGHLERLWNLLDRDTTGNISFIEFTPEAALELSRFKMWAVGAFGSVRKLFEACDRDRSGTITRKEFLAGCRKASMSPAFDKALPGFFELLDAEEIGKKHGSANGVLNWDELQFLERWKPPPYLWEEADDEARAAFQKAIVKKNRGNSLLGWRRCLDKDGSMRVSYEEFCIQCRALAKRGVEEACPACGIPALYAAIDEDRSGWFTLRDWDAEVYDRFKRFVLFAREEFGSCWQFVMKASQIDIDVDEPEVPGLSFRKFSAGLRPLDLSLDARSELFEALQGPGSKRPGGGRHGYLLAKDMQFITKWDPAREAKEDALWGAVMQLHRGRSVLMESEGEDLDA